MKNKYLIEKIDEIEFAMQVVSSNLLLDVLHQTEWTKPAMVSLLQKLDCQVDNFKINHIDECTKKIEFKCLIPFNANEITGIITKFITSVRVEATRDMRTGKINFQPYFAPSGIAPASNPGQYIGINEVRNSICSDNPIVRIDEIISDEFDLEKSCCIFSIN